MFYPLAQLMHQGALKVAAHSFDTCVSFTFFSKAFYPSVAKTSRKQVNNTNFGFLMVKLTYVPLPWQHE